MDFLNRLSSSIASQPFILVVSSSEYSDSDDESESDDEEDSVMHLCDRTDVFAFGLVIWETLSGDVPHAAVHANGEEAYRQALGTRPPLPPNLPQQFVNLEHIYRCCTEHEPDNRPSASELTYWLHPDAEPLQSVHRD